MVVPVDEPDFGLWEGQHGGVHDGPYVGAYLIDANTGQRAKVEEVLEDDWFRVRLDDGRSVRVKLRRPDSDEMQRLRGSSS